MGSSNVSILSSLRQLFWLWIIVALGFGFLLFQSSLHWGNYSDWLIWRVDWPRGLKVSILSSLRQLFWRRAVVLPAATLALCFNPLFIEAIILTLIRTKLAAPLLWVSILSSLRQLFWLTLAGSAEALTVCFNPLFIEAIILTGGHAPHYTAGGRFQSSLHWGNYSDRIFYGPVTGASALFQSSLHWGNYSDTKAHSADLWHGNKFQSSLHWGNYSDAWSTGIAPKGATKVSILSSLRQLFWLGISICWSPVGGFRFNPLFIEAIILTFIRWALQ